MDVSVWAPSIQVELCAADGREGDAVEGAEGAALGLRDCVRVELLRALDAGSLLTAGVFLASGAPVPRALLSPSADVSALLPPPSLRVTLSELSSPTKPDESAAGSAQPLGDAPASTSAAHTLAATRLEAAAAASLLQALTE